MIIVMVSGKTQPESFYVILRRSGTNKNKGDISPNSREISPKRKKSIDLETVVRIGTTTDLFFMDGGRCPISFPCTISIPTYILVFLYGGPKYVRFQYSGISSCSLGSTDSTTGEIPISSPINRTGKCSRGRYIVRSVL